MIGTPNDFFATLRENLVDPPDTKSLLVIL